MNIISEVGIDVSSRTLVIGLKGKKAFPVLNTEESVEAFARELPAGSIIRMEATGGYERLARRILESRGHKVHVYNPRKARRLADAMNFSAKTDEVDARFLQVHGSKLPETRTKSSEHEKLSDISRAIDRLRGDVSNMKKIIRAEWLSPEIVKAYKAVIKTATEQIKSLETQFVKRVKKSELSGQYELAKSIPGVGPITSRVLVSELPDRLDDLSSAQASSYSGLAPLDNSSGKKQGQRKIGKGNWRIKAALYMPAISAIRHQSWARDVYAKLKAKGKAHQQAIVAVMRRLLERIFAVMKRGFPWQENPPNIT